MNGYYSKKLQQSKRYKELQENIQLYYEYSLEKEHKQKSYLNSHKFINSKTGECVNIKYDFEQKYKEYSKVVYQRALSIQEHAKREFESQSMASAFITLTLPSQYYPFKSVKTKKGRLYVSENEEFAFDSLKEAVSAGYKELQKIYQTFYKRVKNLTDIKYIKSVEFSKQMVPHIHLVLFFSFDKLDHVRGTFKRVVEHFNLDRTDFQEVSFKANLNNAAKYLLKYITKDLNSGSDVFKMRVFDGAKRFHKIRVLTTSQLPLNVLVYKKIYNSVSNIEKNKINFKIDDNINTVKEKIDKEVQKLGIPIYLYFQDNFSIEKTIISSKDRKVIKYGKRNSLIKVRIKTIKDGNTYKIREFQIKYMGTEIFRKERYVKQINYDRRI
ncbi:hypothetical protein CRV02_12920 [Arcobacter sp. CECT 8989]|uniref:rolling circle replication-associated protein n=1 Tax=Arcobacter sp. CECT 8989 TaxID=2044509 RepID=UPI00100BE286|nr:hypothetical protein [Arcobacter sp. CECT 8989]RXJ98947.1 hypothetical protein CRV02_12920 [Arcobacter sp. CECT 8989]